MSAVGAMIVATASRLVLEIFEIHILPESAIIIMIGFGLGLLVWAGGSVDLFEFNNSIFFLLLIPPIIFESGYHMDRPSFFANVTLILLYALVGTAVVAALVGLILWGARGLYGFRTDLVQTLTFGSLIAAVDPVAVISIFNEMQVNENLHILVFGESVLNDAVSIVLYNVFLALDGIEFTWQIPFLAFLKFLYVAFGGLIFGIVSGLFTCFFLRFFKPTYHVHVVETLVIALMGWMSFMAAESFLMSGIVSCMFAGITINRYAEGNLHPNSVTTTNYVLSILAGTTETMIFLFLGVQSLITPMGLGSIHSSVSKIWDTGAFLGLTILMIVPFRFMLTYAMGWMENTRRIEKISNEDFFIISYGGLRGAIAFALAWELPRTWPGRIVMVNTVIVCIWFTVFIQGGTIGPIIRFLRVKRREARDPNIAERVIPRVYPHLQLCMRRIYGVNRSIISKWMEKTDRFLESIIHREFDPEAALKEALEAQENGDKGVKEMKKIDEMNLNDFYRATSKFQGPAGMAPDMDAFSRRTLRATAGRSTYRATASQPRQTSRHTRFRDDDDLAPRRGTQLHFKEPM